MNQSGKGGEENRKYKRALASFCVLYTIKDPFLVRISIGNSECSAVAQDIGEGGMALLTNYELPFNSLLTLKFTILNGNVFRKDERTHTFELDAHVRYCLQEQKMAYRLGVCFASISDSDRDYIANYVRSNALIPNSNA